MLLMALVWLVSLRTRADDSTNRFLFLQLRFQAGTVSLSNAVIVSGTLKPQPDSLDAEPLLISLEQTEGQARWSTVIADPSMQRYEYEDPQRPGVLKTKIVQRDDTEFIVRAPLLPGVRHLAVYRRQKVAGLEKNGRAATEKKLLSRLRLPESATE